MKSRKKLIELAECIYRDATAKCTADVSDLRDLSTLRARVNREGLSFLTMTLPDYAKDFEKSLAKGQIDPAYFRSFRKHGAIPVFLKGMLGRLFDRETGRLFYDEMGSRTCDATNIIDGVRQICLAFKKLELSCTPAREAAAITTFVQTEQELSEWDLDAGSREVFRRVAHCIWDPILSRFNPTECRPRHGPGATADGRSGNRKYDWRYWHERLDPYFPLIDSAYSISAVGGEEVERVALLAEEREKPVKVSLVPKTLKAPRIIAVEPCCMQYAQQAIRDQLYRLIESGRWTSGHVNFTDQTINRAKALDASITGSWATLDLSDASDRVPLSLALDMFDCHPWLREAVMACRSSRAKLPNGTVIGPLKKFASMGSALCFPVEAMYFYTSCVVALLEDKGLSVTQDNIKTCCSEVYVYGDDIIVPTRHAVAVSDCLQKYNCKVNMSKSHWTGKFRESCGMDAYDGCDVTPIYIRRDIPRNRRQASELISWTVTANLFTRKGYHRTAQLMFNTAERALGSKLPFVHENSPILGRWSPGFYTIGRFSRKLHRPEVFGWAPKPVYRTDRLGGYAALQKSLARLEGLPSTLRHLPDENPEGEWWKTLDELISIDQDDPKHLERTARYGAVTLKRQWVPAECRKSGG